MKKIKLLTLLIAMGVCVYAQGPRPQMDRTKLPAQLTDQLKLTADQQTSVNKILAEKNVAIDSLVKKANIRNGRLIRANFRSAGSETNEKLYALFDTHQKLVYAQWIIDRRAEMMKRRQGNANGN